MAIIRSIPLPGGARLVIRSETTVATRQISAVRERLNARRLLLENIEAAIRVDAGEQFSCGGNPAWKALAPSTVFQKAFAGLPPSGKPYPSGKQRILPRLKQLGSVSPANILIGSGKLRDSYRRKNDPNHIAIFDERQMTVRSGSKLPYAPVHQTGGRAPYRISARNARFLVWQTATGPVFRRSVWHPPLPMRAIVITQAGRAKIRQVVASHLGGFDGTGTD